ncbi:hypothetical protein ACHAXN_004854 [Cyclotella atomus]
MARIHPTLRRLAVLLPLLAAYQQVFHLSRRNDLFWQEWRDTLDAATVEITRHAFYRAQSAAVVQSKTASTSNNIGATEAQQVSPPARSSAAASQRRYLVADLQFGLTNQAIEAFVAVLLAVQLNRTLVLPKVRPTIPKGRKFALAHSKAEPFSHIWDPDFFIRCARDKLDMPELAFAVEDIHYQAHIAEQHTYSLQRWDGNDNFTPLLAGNASSNDLLTALINDTAEYIKLVVPFHYPTSAKWNSAQCFRPSLRLQSMIDHYKSKLPEKYACLHARTEADWYTVHCCVHENGNTTSPHPHLWTCEGSNSSFHDSEKASQCKQTYATPREISQFLQSDGLSLNSTLWISSGSSRQALSPLYQAFHVYTKETVENYTNNDVFMDYGLAEVDKAVCSGAAQFWGMRGSTFSIEVANTVRTNGGDARWYIN